jgi:hypothetical protein
MGFGGIRIDSPRISERPNVQAAGLPHPRIEVVRVPAFSLSKSAGTLAHTLRDHALQELAARYVGSLDDASVSAALRSGMSRRIPFFSKPRQRELINPPY